MAQTAFRVGFVLFPDLTQLDLTGPYEVMTRMPGAAVDLIWKSTGPVRSEKGLTIEATTTFQTCGHLDMLCVPGGPGVGPLMEDEETLAFLRRAAASVRYLTSVCTGALVLGAAGLLTGKRATTHWMSHDLLSQFGAIPVTERVVVDGAVITGGGVTAGIDFALRIVAEVAGEAVAREVQLAIEYDPLPPFDSGSPRVADETLVARMRERSSARQRSRADIARRAAARLAETR